MYDILFFISYSSAFLLFSFLLVLLLSQHDKNSTIHDLIFLSLANMIWALEALLSDFTGNWGQNTGILLALRNLAWIYVIERLAASRFQETGYTDSMKRWGLRACLYAIACLPAILKTSAQTVSFHQESLLGIIISVAGLVLLENYFRNSNSDERWAIKFICFGAGLTFVYDISLYSKILLTQSYDPQMELARGIIAALAVPLIAVAISRKRHWSINIHVSRNVVFHSFTLIGVGCYLVIIAASGYLLEKLHTEWGTFAQIVLVSGSAVVLLVIFSSQALRNKLHYWISRNFYSTPYDYRAEWLKFIYTISKTEDRRNLRRRVLGAVADIVDAHGGAIWVHSDEDQSFVFREGWNVPTNTASLSKHDPIVTWVMELKDVLELTALEDHDNPDLATSDILNIKDGWLVLPLIHREQVCAIILLLSSRSERELGFAEIELLLTVARQGGSYIAEEETLNALSDARKLQEFNKRSAFLVHDTKNIVSQLNLMLRNAEKHKDNPEFHADMMQTVGSAVGKMQTLLQKLQNQNDEPDETPPENSPSPAVEQPVEITDLLQVLTDLKDEWRLQAKEVQIHPKGTDVYVCGKAKEIGMALNHLIRNAWEALPTPTDDKLVIVTNQTDSNHAKIEIIDDGMGMDQKFIDTELFSPLKSSKKEGMGIGAFQAREVIRGFGGSIDVKSTQGKGTHVTVSLPLRKQRLRG